MSISPGAWSIVVASDIIRDGLGVELIDPNNQVVAEVFRCDADHTVTYSQYVDAIPFFALEKLIRRAKERLDPFEDGLPLDSASPDN